MTTTEAIAKAQDYLKSIGKNFNLTDNYTEIINMATNLIAGKPPAVAATTPVTPLAPVTPQVPVVDDGKIFGLPKLVVYIGGPVLVIGGIFLAWKLLKRKK
jgi:hypothetical protein